MHGHDEKTINGLFKASVKALNVAALHINMVPALKDMGSPAVNAGIEIECNPKIMHVHQV